MKKDTAQQILLAWAEIKDIENRLSKIYNKMYDRDNPEEIDILDDINFTINKIVEAMEGIYHHIEDAQDIVTHKRKK